jgi:sec-independent protein translocase protein TatA
MSVGIWQLLLIFLIILLLFGAGRLPQVMKDLGQGIKNFKKELHNEKKDDINEKDK